MAYCHFGCNMRKCHKKSDHQRCDYKGDLLYNTLVSGSNYKNKWAIINYKRIHSYISGISHNKEYKNFALEISIHPKC